MQKHFVSDYYSRERGYQPKQANKRLVSSSPSLFDFSQGDREEGSNVSKYFFEDNNAWYYIESVVPEIDKEKLRNDLRWFQEQIRKPKSERYKYYQTLDEKNNELIIDKFCHLKEKPDKNGRVQAPYFTAALRLEIRDLLIGIYCKKEE